MAKSLAQRLVEVVDELPDLDHVFVLDDEVTGSGDDARPGADLPDLGRVAVHRWTDLQSVDDRQPSMIIRPSDRPPSSTPAGPPGPQGLHAHPQLPRGTGPTDRDLLAAHADDVVWTPLPLYHFNALTTVVVGTFSTAGGGRSTGSSRCPTSGPR